MTKQELFLNMMTENIAAGFVRGQEIFQESLNDELQKSEILEGIELGGYVDALIANFDA